jgi:hypothetical protein
VPVPAGLLRRQICGLLAAWGMPVDRVAETVDALLARA